jgi:AAA15 family ATPase/GTPase
VLEVTLPLNGFSISNFKSFYGPQQLVGPLKQINVIIGENNSGKSNVVRYLRKVVSVANTKAYVVSAEDIPKNNTTFSSKYTLNLQTKSSLIGVFARTEGINANIFEQNLEYFLGIQPLASEQFSGIHKRQRTAVNNTRRSKKGGKRLEKNQRLFGWRICSALVTRATSNNFPRVCTSVHY